jgi:hypothetical protein
MRAIDRKVFGSAGPAALLAIAVASSGGVGCGGGSEDALVRASDIPVAHTPPGGYGDEMPAPILARCNEPLAREAPDLRGLWKTRTAEINGELAPEEHPIRQHVERIEQCGDRVVVTSSGVIHDMRADGTLANGVNDVSALNFQPIRVAATFEGGALVLRPDGVEGFEVTRARDGAELVWHYGPTILVRLERIDL